MESITLKTTTLDGRQIAYSSVTVFQVQIGKGKSAYKTRYYVMGDLYRAVMHHNAINISNGYKKRLIGYGLNKPILARQFSA